MEFPELDKHCKICRQLDFLPFKCDFCKELYCLEHKDPKDHECKNITNYESKQCYKKRCKNKIYVKSCENCQKNFCIDHRFHDCPKIEITNNKNLIQNKKSQKICTVF